MTYKYFLICSQQIEEDSLRRANRTYGLIDFSICAIVRSDPLSIPEDVLNPTFKLSFVIDKIQKSNSNWKKIQILF